MGYYYIELGEYEKAIEYLNNSNETEENSYNYNFVYGNYYEKIGELEKAKEYYEKAMRSSISAFRIKKNEKIIQRFNIDIEDIKKQNEEEREKNYNTFIEL